MPISTNSNTSFSEIRTLMVGSNTDASMSNFRVYNIFSPRTDI